MKRASSTNHAGGKRAREESHAEAGSDPRSDESNAFRGATAAFSKFTTGTGGRNNLMENLSAEALQKSPKYQVQKNFA